MSSIERNVSHLENKFSSVQNIKDQLEEEFKEKFDHFREHLNNQHKVKDTVQSEITNLVHAELKDFESSFTHVLERKNEQIKYLKRTIKQLNSDLVVTEDA